MRARFKSDIRAVFADAEVAETAEPDNRYRARLPAAADEAIQVLQPIDLC